MLVLGYLLCISLRGDMLFVSIIFFNVYILFFSVRINLYRVSVALYMLLFSSVINAPVFQSRCNGYRASVLGLCDPAEARVACCSLNHLALTCRLLRAVCGSLLDSRGLVLLLWQPTAHERGVSWRPVAKVTACTRAGTPRRDMKHGHWSLGKLETQMAPNAISMSYDFGTFSGRYY